MSSLAARSAPGSAHLGRFVGRVLAVRSIKLGGPWFWRPASPALHRGGAGVGWAGDGGVGGTVGGDVIHMGGR